MSIPFGMNAQRVFTGLEASSKYKNAEVVRESQFSTLPSFIKFRKSEQVDIDDLRGWMASNIKFDPNMDFVLLRKDVDILGQVHYRYQQTYYGQPLEDAIWIAHTNNDKIYSLNGLIYDKITSPTSAGLSEEAALAKAIEFVGATTYKWELPGEEQHLKWETGDESATYQPKGELTYISDGFDFAADNYRLVYKFNIYAHEPVSRANIYVDANTGKIIRENKIICHADEPGVAHTGYSGERDIIADSFGGEYRLRDGSRGDGVRTFDLNTGTEYGGAVDFIDDDNDWDNANPEQDEYATDAHWGAEMTYDYYFDIHGRNSIDNTGFQLNSYVHYSSGFVNAFWDGSRMTYGDGSGGVTPLTSIDIAAHEVTHGLTTFTAGLIYAAESGALNESFSDIFGVAIERFGRPGDWNWLLGEDIGLTLRSLSNPNSFGDPDTYFGDFWAPLDGGDSGGVHTNSGVQNFWYYLLTLGGTGTNDNGDDYDVDGLGFEASSAIAFRNLTVYLTPSSPFADARFFSIESAVDLYGVCTFEVEQTANAWYAVGVGEVYNPVTEADFFTADTSGCALPFTVNFSNESTNAITYEWDFGDGETSTEENPVHIYTEAGVYTVTLFADGGDCGTDEITFTDYITVDPEADCITILSSGINTLENGCDGIVYDSGGPGATYGASEDAQVTIAPYGAVSVNLSFPFFDVEEGPGETCNYDYVEIYDGPDEFAPLIDRYCNNNLPSDLTSSGSSITIVFHSDGGLEEDGFEIEWSCNLPEEAPEAAFTANSEFSCDGTVHFVDVSTNSPTEWAWDFGDGGTSDEQNPTHTYAANGTYDVTLTATNIIGENEVIEVDYITVEITEAPTTTGDDICKDQSTILTAEGTDDLEWFDEAIGGELINVGPSFTTPVLASTTTYYVQSRVHSDSEFVGPDDNTFGGGGIFAGDQHLVFNCLSPVILKSVTVYADGGGNRTIELRNSAGDVLQSAVINIPDGESEIDLNFQLPVADGLQLGTAFGSSPDLYRNNSGPEYPYILPGKIEITQSSAGTDPFAYYYFFYDWKILTYDCASDRTPVTADVVDCLGIDEENAPNVQIYPNPSNGIITINTGELNNGNIVITDLLGKTVARIPFNSNNFTVDLNDYQARGTYLVEFYDENGDLRTTKKIVKH